MPAPLKPKEIYMNKYLQGVIPKAALDKSFARLQEIKFHNVLHGLHILLETFYTDDVIRAGLLARASSWSWVMCHRLNNSGAFQARDCKWDSKFDENAKIYTMHEKILKTPELLPLHEKLELTITKMEEEMDFMHNYLTEILKEDITLKFLVAVYAVMADFLNHLKMARKFTNEEPGRAAESSEPPAKRRHQ